MPRREVPVPKPSPQMRGGEYGHGRSPVPTIPYRRPVPTHAQTSPALNSDPYRTRSLQSGMNYQHPQQMPQHQHQHVSQHPFRPVVQVPPKGQGAQGDYFDQRPQGRGGLAATAQGRIVPGRAPALGYPQESGRAATMTARVPVPPSMQGLTLTDSPPIVESPEEVAPRYPSTKQKEGKIKDDVTQRKVSVQSLPPQLGSPNMPGSNADRSLSFSGTTQSTLLGSERRSSVSGSTNTVKGSYNASNAILTTSRRTPLVYPALLSRVAEVFRTRTPLAPKTKDGLTYQDAFLGCEAVDVIAYIIRTTDRNLALLLGRALDAQRFLHDVTYTHRLRDSPNEVYRFRDRLAKMVPEADGRGHPKRGDTMDSLEGVMVPPSPAIGAPVEKDEGADLPNGVFTLLTECYSPTCTRDRLCYSIACPRRLEQQARLNMKPQPVLRRTESQGSLGGDKDDQEQKLWIHSVSKEVADSVDDREKKRQEVICECIYTERDFVKDLEYLRDFWMKPLRTMNVIPEHRRDKIIRTVFSNALEIHAVNSRLADALTRRQNQKPVVHSIGDIFLEWIPHFDPFIRYGANQLYGKYEFEKEKSSNPYFMKFVDDTERLKESRKLELNGYLTKPTTRLARYPLLLEAVLKYTADDNPDKKDLPKAIEMVRTFLSRVNQESGKSENRFNLMQLNTQLVFKPGEQFDLKLTDEHRQMIFKGALKKRNVGATNTDSSSDIQLFLFDHSLLMVKFKVVSKREHYKVHRKPIPLELLVLTQYEDPTSNSRTLSKRPSSSLLPGASVKTSSSSLNLLPGASKDSSNKGYPLTFTHLGRRGYNITLYATTFVSRRKWIEHIEAQQKVIKEKSHVFIKGVVSEGYFMGSNRVNCAVPYEGGNKLVYGTDNGIYISDRIAGVAGEEPMSAPPVRVLPASNVQQIEVLEDYGLLLVLADKVLYSYALESLDPNDTTLANKRPKKVAGHTQFFRAGVCLGRVLVCVVKSNSLSSTIKVFEPVAQAPAGKKTPAFKKLLQNNTETLKMFKELAIPSESSSVSFLKSKLCVGCAKGFEVVSLENLETQSLLDPADTSLDFVNKRENIKPIAIYRMNGEFLLCYDEFAFFVNRNGWRARPEWIINWEGMPRSTSFYYPYILGFDPNLIEIYNIETGALVQVVPGVNIRKLRDNEGLSGEILFACDGRNGGDRVVGLRLDKEKVQMREHVRTN
ncbi:CNH-domain-containing protein [Saitoella complicata NRRL Y-17804]|uniref:CNH-domain-containing protein n=1 Tax=Saitoella complicata (strain BCRC 22490 / CBS 7301 / JCM 7358 / NBRC 10748 / NRRL Y-17804) TaxID=698492 RepID=UPI000867D853|nr:CNH-domain-containing protein [Saitoella complicata NRRL Y-17804]ODQ49792.1 CNH-domain-containing protein [Saitoella complicata NRRL Y-17804]